MLRHCLAGIAGLLFLAGGAIAADHEVRGKLISLDADGNRITISERGKTVEYGLNARGVLVTVHGKESKAGLSDRALVKGADVVLTIPATGKLVREIEVTRMASTTTTDRPAISKDKPTTTREKQALTDRHETGSLVSVDSTRHEITISAHGKNVTYPLNSRDLVVRVHERESRDGIQDRSLTKGAEVTLVIPDHGKLVKEIVVGHPVATNRGAARTTRPQESTGSPDRPGASTDPRHPDNHGKGEKFEPRGTPAIVERVDHEKMTLSVKVDGKRKDLKISEDTKFIGPRGGHRGTGEKGLKDDTLAPDAEIRFVESKNGKEVEEIHLPMRHASQ